MADLLSDQIAEISTWLAAYESTGVPLEPVAVVGLAGVLGEFVSQARMLEQLVDPHAAALARLADDVREEAAAVEDMAAGLARTNAVLRGMCDGSVVLFPRASRRPGDVSVEAALSMLRAHHLDDGGAA